jgi:hypothetical protein
MYTAIFDRRIKAAVLSCSLGDYYGHGIELDELCGSQVVPGILQLILGTDRQGQNLCRSLWAQRQHAQPVGHDDQGAALMPYHA